MEKEPNNQEKLVGIKNFLIESNKAGYGGGEERQWIKEADQSTSINYESKDGAWKFHDNFFGGEPYGGREVISHQGKPEWLMIYYGEVSDKELDKNLVYAFLRKALIADFEGLPVRGPANLSETIDGQVWTYENSWTGDLERFAGHEYIKLDGRQIYDAEYSGGLVDQHPAV